MFLQSLGHFIPLFAIQFPPPSLRRVPTPLLEKERHTLLKCLVPKLDNPRLADWSALRPRFPADDDPVNVGEVHFADRADQRFKRNEAHSSGGPAEVVDPVLIAGILDRNSDPDILWPGLQFRGNLHQSLVPFGEHLVDMPRGLAHDLEDLLQKVEGHFLVEEVAHGVDEDQARLLPPPRFVQPFGVKGKAKPVGEVVRKALRDALGVAILAARAHFGAARRRVPRLLRPLDRRARACHIGKSLPLLLRSGLHVRTHLALRGERDG